MAAEQPGVAHALVDLMEKGVQAQYAAAREAVRSARFAAHTAHAMAESYVFPAVGSLLGVQEHVARSLLGALRGNGGRAALKDTWERLTAAARFPALVATMGKSLYGSATLPGEEVIARHRWFRLVHVPPAPGTTAGPLALFHAGGAIPYGDRIFRLAPGFDFYGRFAARGVPVYAMELHGDRDTASYADLSIEGLVECIEVLSDAAFEHRGGRRMALEGYCGHGTQALAYLAGRPQDAARKFHTFCMFVSPVDGRRCGALAESVAVSPEALVTAQLDLAQAMGGYVPADGTRMGIDLPLRAAFHKSLPGYLAMGWDRRDLAGVRSTDELTAEQRRDLAGTYWVSPDCVRRWPIPVGMARYTEGFFRKGVSRRGDLPATLDGEPLTLRRVVDETDVSVVGFYGGRDPVVPDATGHVLLSVFGDRYRHVVHPDAGHISYVLSPETWAPDSPRALVPNPVDVLLDLTRP